MELLIEEVDDPCRRRQPDGEAVYLSDPLIRLARAAITKALKAGEDLPGCRLTQSRSLRVKTL